MKKNREYGVNYSNHLIDRLIRLPHMILKHHNVEGLSELVLHELGHEGCFGLKRAVYLIDNPDFDHMKGVAGFCKDECVLHKTNPWHDPKSFHHDMRNAVFHNQLKRLTQTSLKRKGIDIHNSEDIKELATMLGMENHQSLGWDLRHGNYGLLLFEKSSPMNDQSTHLLNHVAALLGLCHY